MAQNKRNGRITQCDSVYMAQNKRNGRITQCDSVYMAQNKRNDLITQCDSVYMARHPRGSCIVHPLLLSLEAAPPEKKSINSTLSSIRKRFEVGCSSPFMRLVEHLTAFRASCKQFPPGPSNPDELRPSIEGMRGSTVIRPRPCMT